MAFSAGGGAERGRAGESVSWIGSRGLEELGTCFFGFQRETWEHQDLFAGWWFGTFGLFFHILGMS